LRFSFSRSCRRRLLDLDNTYKCDRQQDGVSAAITPFGRWRVASSPRTLAAMPEKDQVTAPRITERQREVVELIAAGCSNEEVGLRLGISARTAKAHADVLRRKLGVARRRQIPAAYRALTGEDPLAPNLEPMSFVLGD
jgi:DNA-binding NarL/FixJ family response regulator